MTGLTSMARDQQAVDALALDLYPACGGCGNVCPPGATLCECGRPLLWEHIPPVEEPRK